MNPYKKLPSKAFWKLAVADKPMFEINDLWDPKFHIKQNENVVTFGSCFAQHIGNAMKERGFKWLSTELPPVGLSREHSKKYNYNIFSARTGNIYTTTLLKQWTEWALGIKDVPNEVWEDNGRFYDPFRPRVEPNGFSSPEEVRQSLNQTIDSFKQSIESADYFVFTLGLTESWVNVDGYEYPMCPGTAAGDYDETKHKFINQQFSQILTALMDSMALMQSVNTKLKFILTVSPVPLTATNSNQHVAIATMASKSVLRAVTHQLVTSHDDVDYFPSYEIINSPIFKGAFFEVNQRNVTGTGVNFVMDNFFKCLVGKYGEYEINKVSNSGVITDKGKFSIVNSLKRLVNKSAKHSHEEVRASVDKKSDAVCEEELLERFRK